MIIPEIFSDWLQQPAPFPEAQREELEALAKQYPYFVPVRYMLAAGTPDAFSAIQPLYLGNRVLFAQLHAQAVQLRLQPPAREQQPPLPDEPIIIADTLDDTVMQGLDIPHPHSDPAEEKQTPLFQPIYTEDYFLHQGIQVPDELPAEKELVPETDPKNNTLMVMMSFTEWLMHFKTSKEKEKEEQEDKRALKTMWQKEKLAAALEEEDDEIPETVFEMAVNSIAKEEGLASESLAEILIKQGKYDKAIDMYQKLSLRNPQKNAYFAAKIDAIIKLKDS